VFRSSGTNRPGNDGNCENPLRGSKNPYSGTNCKRVAKTFVERWDMFETVSQEPEFVFVIVLTAIVFGTMALTVLGVTGMVILRRHQTTRMAHDMKMEMLAQGMSADEIERVLATKVSGR
jgi:hypothetical protein